MVVKKELNKAKYARRLGLLNTSLKYYTQILEAELQQPEQHSILSPLTGDLKKIEEAALMIEQTSLFNLYLKLSDMFFKENSYQVSLERLKSTIYNVKKKFEFKAALEIQQERIDLSKVTLLIIDCVDFNRAELAYTHCINSAKFGDAKILTHEKRDETYVENITKIESVEEYSRFCVEELANYFDTEFVLIAQWDGFIWNSELWDPKFLEYDYLGAPWEEYNILEGIPKSFNVGNGGFSLRSKKLQDFLRDNKSLGDVDYPEDVYIAQVHRGYLESQGFKFAPYELAVTFSYEDGEFRRAFGVHNRLILTK